MRWNALIMKTEVIIMALFLFCSGEQIQGSLFKSYYVAHHHTFAPSVSTSHSDNKVTIFHNQLNVDGITEHSKRNMHWQVKIEFLIINASEKIILRAGDRNAGNFTSDTWNLHINETLFKCLICCVSCFPLHPPTIMIFLWIGFIQVLIPLWELQHSKFQQVRSMRQKKMEKECGTATFF